MPKYYYLQLIRKRLAWILMYEKGHSVSKVCLHFGISRKCFYKWQRRYRASGNEANSLLDRSRRPMYSPRLTSKHIQSLIVKLRKATNFGPDRIRLFLLKDYSISVPRATIQAILRRKGLIKKAKRRPKKPRCYTMPYPG
ncbi:MAG: helix-turn-helix domain-containing protein, partial [Candidatus Brocadiaceae bacterium]|nr:helix-turn-helix domain-containing protein [Candidatus Brocadiaceae bacterium]